MKELLQNTESSFYQQLAQMHPMERENDLGIGDDGACIYDNICISKDLAVEGVHFDLKWSSFKQVVTKTLVSNLSDLYSMGATPRYFLCGIVSPNLKTDLIEYKEVVRFLADKYSIQLIGGDLSTGKETVISMTAIGEIRKNRLLRSNCKMGDSLYLMGRPGLSKWVLDNLKNDQLATMSELTINYHLEAMSCLELGSKILSLNGITAAMDLSDGLSLTCHEMSSQSQVKFVLDQQKFRFPKPLDSLELNQKMEYFLTSGEEYFSLVSIAQHIEIPIALSKDPDFFQVGEVQQGIGVEIITQKGKICTLKEIGFSHFD